MDCNIFIPENWKIKIETGHKLHKIIFENGKENVIAIQIPDSLLKELRKQMEGE